MLVVTCTNIIKSDKDSTICYELEDSTGKKFKISYYKLKLLLKNKKLRVVNLKLSADKIIENPNYQTELMISKLKMLSSNNLITYPSACGHNYYVLKSPKTTILYIPDDVKYLFKYSLKQCAEYCNIECEVLKVIGGQGLVFTSDLFYNCKAKEIDLSDFTTSNVIRMDNMFQSCCAERINIEYLDTSNVISMRYMFCECKAKSLDLSNFNTSNVTDMLYMFSGCNLKHLDLKSFDTSQVTRMSYMFSGCTIESVDLSSFNTSNVIEMFHMFYWCNIDSLDLSTFDTSNVENMCKMFARCNTEHLDLSAFNTAKVQSMTDMFFGCTAKSIDISSFDTQSIVTDISTMFEECKAEIKVKDEKLLKLYKSKQT